MTGANIFDLVPKTCDPESQNYDLVSQNYNFQSHNYVL